LAKIEVNAANTAERDAQKIQEFVVIG
jgi:hypothetical protein